MNFSQGAGAGFWMALPQEAPRTAVLSGDEEQSLAAREAKSPDLAGFEGGDTGVSLLVVVLLVVLIWYLLIEAPRR